MKVTADTAATPESVFAALKDPQTWNSWSGMESVRLAEPGTDEPNGVGSIRAIDKGRLHGRDQVVELVDGKRFSYVHLSGLPLRDYRADVDLEAGATSTRITWQATFRPKYAGTGWIWKRGIRGMLKKLADGVGTFAADGGRA